MAIWNEFHECVHKMKYIIYVLCKHCNISYVYPEFVGRAEDHGIIRSISRHLIKCISYNTQKNKGKISDFKSRMKMNQTMLDDYNDNTMIDKVLKFFISGNIAFNQIDNPYFQDLIYYEEMKIKDSKINRKSVHARLTEIGREVKEDFMIILMKNNSKINLILDC